MRVFLRIGALLLAAALAACENAPLYSALDEQQANEVEAALLSAGIDAGKKAAAKGNVWAVHVARRDVPQAMAVLRARGLPRAPLDSMGEVFRKEGFVSSPLEERARYVHALSQELSQTLMQIDGVVSARVHIALPEQHLLREQPESASASVVVVEAADANLRERETDIKAIVTDGVEGLDDVNRVTVKFFKRADRTQAVASLPALRPAASTTGLLALALAGGLGLAGWVQMRRRRGGDQRGDGT